MSFVLLIGIGALRCVFSHVIQIDLEALVSEREVGGNPLAVGSLDTKTPAKSREKGQKRGYLLARGEIHTERMAKVLLDEYRSGKLGHFTLEMPEEQI